MIERSRLSDEEGLSLIEVLVAIVLLGLIMGAMARSLTTSMFTAQGQERQVHATSLVREMLEEARGLAWPQLGLCEDDVTAEFPGGSYTYPDGTSEVVVPLAMADDVCSPLENAPLRAVSQVVRNGVTYDVLTLVTWTDDELDDPADGSPDPDGEDLKHVWVQATWDHRGQSRVTASETFVSEDAVTPVLSTEVIHYDPPSPDYTYLNAYDGLNANDGLTQTDVLLRATAIIPQSGVVVRWLTADGTLVENKSMTPSNGGLTFEFTIPNGSPDFDVNRLSNGETVFEFTATDAATGRQTVVFDRGLFLIEPSAVGISEAHLTDATGSGEILRVDEAGTLCSDTTLEIFVDGLLRSDFVTAVWTRDLGQQAMEGVASDHRGARFAVQLEGPVTLTDENADGVGDGGTITVSFYLQRNGDSYTLGQDPATATSTTWEPSEDFTVVVAC